MLYTRYGNPVDLMQRMLETGQFCDFVGEVVNIRNEEVNEKTMWEYYLHRVFDMDFDEFMRRTRVEEPKPVDMNDVEATVKASEEILKSFKM